MGVNTLNLIDGAQTVFFKAGEEWCYLRTPEGYDAQSSTTPFVIQCHGNGGYVRDGEADWLDEESKTFFLNSLLNKGIAVAGSHGTGNHWGRPDAVAAYGALFNALTYQPGLSSSQTGLMGGGLGGAALWNSVTGPLLGRVKAVVPQQATLSYESVITAGKFKGPLLEAYGLPANTPNDLAIAALKYNDPLNRTRLLVAQHGHKAASLFPEVMFVHGDIDENMLYEENPIALSEVLKSCGANYSFETFKGIGHATYDLREKASTPIAAFFQKSFNI